MSGGLTYWLVVAGGAVVALSLLVAVVVHLITVIGASTHD